MSTRQEKVTLGVIVGHRGFFPAHLVDKGRDEILRVLKEEGINSVVLSPTETKHGAVETRDDAKKCAELFRKNSSDIAGILITLPNFGDERGIAEAIRMANLKVPILIHAYPDEPNKMRQDNRRDSFCGKMSVCNNLNQYGFRYSLTRQHTVHPDNEDFREDVRWFAKVCRVVNGLQKARIGAIGTRPAPFATVRYSEKLLERVGISVEVIDLSEIFSRIQHLTERDEIVQNKLKAIKNYVHGQKLPPEILLRMAKFAGVVETWMQENDLVATAIQCWTSLQENYGISPCLIMSMMSESLLPSACEVDVEGAVAMYALQLASGNPSALADWNNNFGRDPDKVVMFHCSNWPKSILKDIMVDYHDIISGAVEKEKTYGVCEGRIKSGPVTFARIATDDSAGTIHAYVGEGEFTGDQLSTFGGCGVMRVKRLPELLQFICYNGFEHHVAINPSSVAKVLHHAIENYLGWNVYYHRP